MRKVRTLLDMQDRKQTTIQMWEAYRDLFKLIEVQNKWSRDNLVDALNRDAERKIKPKCTYDRRSTEYWEERPKPAKPPRKPRAYRQEHLHGFFCENVVTAGKPPEFIARLEALLSAIALPAVIGLPVGFIKVDLTRFVPGLKPLNLRYGDSRCVSDLTTKVYLVISGFVEPFHYGHSWVLRNKKTGKIINHRRIIEGLGKDYPVTDPRPLVDEDITPGTELEAVAID